jgi:hypothetical protein
MQSVESLSDARTLADFINILRLMASALYWVISTQ